MVLLSGDGVSFHNLHKIEKTPRTVIPSITLPPLHKCKYEDNKKARL